MSALIHEEEGFNNNAEGGSIAPSLIKIFPYFVIGFVGLIILRNIGDELFLQGNYHTTELWNSFVENVKNSAKIFLSMAMAAIGLSANLKDLRSIGYKPFVVGFIAMLTVGLMSVLTMQSFTKLFLS